MNNKGSIIVEMCFIAPILAGVVFLAINLLAVVMNYAAAAGEAYAVLYNREEYVMVGGLDDREPAENVMESNVEENTVFVEDVKATSYVSEQGMAENEIDYREKYPGVFRIVNHEKDEKKVVAKREIRDTANNLRRWQTYGELLPE